MHRIAVLICATIVNIQVMNYHSPRPEVQTGRRGRRGPKLGRASARELVSLPRNNPAIPWLIDLRYALGLQYVSRAHIAISVAGRGLFLARAKHLARDTARKVRTGHTNPSGHVRIFAPAAGLLEDGSLPA
jgi:hypothetical protein